MKQAYHQHEPRKFSASAFEKFKNRQEVDNPKEGEVYVDPDNYPDTFFTWHPFSSEQKKLSGNKGVAGEWRMGHAEVK
jgi:hypothetical protein